MEVCDGLYYYALGLTRNPTYDNIHNFVDIVYTFVESSLKPFDWELGEELFESVSELDKIRIMPRLAYLSSKDDFSSDFVLNHTAFRKDLRRALRDVRVALTRLCYMAPILYKYSIRS